MSHLVYAKKVTSGEAKQGKETVRQVHEEVTIQPPIQGANKPIVLVSIFSFGRKYSTG